MHREKIILDCDPGHDDAVAIMLAGKSECIDLIGITVVAGNQTLDNTLRNTLNICQYLNIDVPVYAGCSGPLVRKKVIAGDIHGNTGLDGPVFEKLEKKAEIGHAVNFIIKTLKESKEKITIVTTGPMTNIALALKLAPEILENIKKFIFMGGSYQNGNVTPAAEFNIFADAEAAHIILNTKKPIYMIGLDVSRKVLCTPDIVERMSKINNNASRLFKDLMGHFCKTQKEIFGWNGGPLHDPLTIAYLIKPEIFKMLNVHGEIELRSKSSYGRTNCDIFNYQKKKKNMYVATDIDVEEFWNIIEDMISKYS